jgi:hypothetical protein
VRRTIIISLSLSSRVGRAPFSFSTAAFLRSISLLLSLLLSLLSLSATPRYFAGISGMARIKIIASIYIMCARAATQAKVYVLISFLYALYTLITCASICLSLSPPPPRPAPPPNPYPRPSLHNAHRYPQMYICICVQPSCSRRQDSAVRKSISLSLYHFPLSYGLFRGGAIGPIPRACVRGFTPVYTS